MLQSEYIFLIKFSKLAPFSTKELNNNNIKAGTSSQNEILLSLGN